VSAKCALIVDDSQAARMVLSRMLQQYAIDVDMAGSAEEAIEYLHRQRPDAIFMDHQMPGMDGLQAVKIIKNDPRTAMIPIMMYTSQEGELYVGQARALGAVGVLPKQVSPIDVSKVLFELRLLPDRRDGRPSSLQPVAGRADLTPAAAPAVAPSVPPELNRPTGDPRAFEREVRAAVEPLLKAQSSELRRLLMASLDSFAARPLTETRDTAAAQAEPTAAPRPARSVRPIAWMMVSALATGALLFALSLLWRQGRDVDELRARLATAERAIAAADARAAERAADYEAARSALQALKNAAPGGPDVPRILPVGYGETPLAGSRLEALRGLMVDLEQRGASGIAQVTSYAADFCLVGNPTDGYSLAPDDVPAKTCDLTGNPFDDALRGPQRESRAFAEFVATLPGRSHGALSIVTREGGHTKPLAAYPSAADSSAAQWNAAANTNQRVEISFTSRTSAP